METAEVRTEKFVFGGQTIAKIGTKTVFIPYALPDETLSINIVQHKNDYDNAQIINIIEPSPYRKEPECKYYGACGGCNMMHIQSEYQKQLRLQMLKDSFISNKIDLDELELPVQIISGPDFNYRARFQLTDGGLCTKSQNNIVEIDQCLCAEPVINEYLEKTDAANRPKGRVHVFGSSKVCDKEAQIKLYVPEDKPVQKNIQSGNKSKKLKLKENHHFAGTVLSPQNLVTVELLNRKITFDVRGFFQSNLFVFEKVIKLITQVLPGGTNILDMYSGCGSISCFLGEKYSNVVLVEHNRDALVFAEQNMTGIKHTSYGLSGEAWAKTCASSCPAFDAAVVDPPRSGMEKAVLDYFCKSGIPFIVYLSCNPSTQSRDCARLMEAGYKIESAYLLDFYPNTSHIESLVVLSL
ncbi:MAG: class I SAM-dependent RNA methyltransferase [Treponema sp.]|nr:class I SAM-dependent RNA methyltransferase [Treponema sp.]